MKKIFEIIEATVVQIPTGDESGNDIFNETGEPQAPKSRLLMTDDSGRAELVRHGYWEDQFDYLKRYSGWRPIYHMGSAPLSVGDKIRIVGATTNSDEEGAVAK